MTVPEFDARAPRPVPSHVNVVCPSPQCGELRTFPRRADGYVCSVCHEPPPGEKRRAVRGEERRTPTHEGERSTRPQRVTATGATEAVRADELRAGDQVLTHVGVERVTAEPVPHHSGLVDVHLVALDDGAAERVERCFRSRPFLVTGALLERGGVRPPPDDGHLVGQTARSTEAKLRGNETQPKTAGELGPDDGAQLALF